MVIWNIVRLLPLIVITANYIVITSLSNFLYHFSGYVVGPSYLIYRIRGLLVGTRPQNKPRTELALYSALFLDRQWGL